MPEATSSTVKKTTRRKAASSLVTPNILSSSAELPVLPKDKNIENIMQVFSDLLNRIKTAQTEFEKLQKEIITVKEAWIKEQKDHELGLNERKQQEEIIRKREQETYDYETKLLRKKTEDEFLEKKTKWEKELQERKEEIENDKKELEVLRKQVASFETEKNKAIKEACFVLQKELTDKFETEERIREQEFKAEKELLNLNIENLTSENTKLSSELTTLKKALEEATRQVKDIAVKVIESSNTNIISTQIAQG